MAEHLAPPIWAPRAWLPAASATASQPADAWQTHVLLQIGPDGRWSAITAGVTQPPPNAQRMPGPLLPGLVNAHSHAFQRAFAGLTERRDTEAEADDLWSWRDRMYRVALRITPGQLQAIAAQLYLELLQGGYTQAPAEGQPAAAQRLFTRALQAGAAACGEGRWGLLVGARADALLADPADPALLGIPAERGLNAQVFSSPVRPWQALMVAGRWVIR